MYYIYAHTLIVDGRKYIGITKQSLNERWRGGSGYKQCSYFGRAINKYGLDSFIHEVIDTCETKEEAYELEKYYISKYDTTNHKKGFNLQEGEEGSKQHASTCRKMSNLRKGYKFSGTALLNIQNHAKEMSINNTGKKRSEETKKKISKAHTGMKYGEETKQKIQDAFSVPVVCIELNKVYPSMTSAAEAFGLKKCTISAVIKGRNKTAAGYHWKLA